MNKSVKILVLNQPFDNQTGGGITFSNLFEGVDPDHIAIVCPAQLINSQTNFEKSNHYYQLGSLEQRWGFPFNQMSSKNYSGVIAKEGQPSEKLGSSLETHSFKGKLVNDMVFPLIKYLGVHQASYSLVLSVQLLAWIDEFNPTIIYAQAQNIQQVRFCQQVLEAVDVPFIFHMMDDWVSLASQSGLSKLIWMESTDRAFRKLLQSSDKILTVSDYMAEEYLSRYGVESEVFHNPVDEAFWTKHQKTDLALSAKPTILYAGRVGLGIDSSLILMAKAVERLNENLDTKVNFVVQTQLEPDWIKNYENVTYKELVPYEDLPYVFGNADLLFLPYDFSKESIEFIKFSMPTKASEYMICGTPILIMAPEDTAIVKNALKLGWASVLTDYSLEKLTNSLSVLLFDPISRLRFSESARNVARNYHTKTIVQKRFFKILNDFSTQTSHG